QDVGRDLVLGPAELSQGGEEDQVIEGLLRQRQTQWTRLGAVFGPGHAYASRLQRHYNGIITLAWRIESCEPFGRRLVPLAYRRSVPAGASAALPPARAR